MFNNDKFRVFKLTVTLYLFGLSHALYAFNMEAAISGGLTDVQLDGELNFTNLGQFTHETQEAESEFYTYTMTFAFDDVSLAAGPWQESLFLNHSSYASVAYAKIQTEVDVEYDNSLFTDFSADYENTSESLFLRGVVGPIILHGNYSETHYDDSDFRTTMIALGGYISESQEVILSYHQNREAFDTLDDLKSQTLTVTYSNLFALGDSFFKVTALLSRNKLDDDYDTRRLRGLLGLSVFPVDNFAINLKIDAIQSTGENASREEDINETSLQVGLSYYLLPQLAIFTDLAYGEGNMKFKSRQNLYQIDYDTETSEVGVGMIFRF